MLVDERLPKGHVAQVLHRGAGGIGDPAGGAEVVGMAEIDLVLDDVVARLQRNDDAVQLRIVETGGSHDTCGAVRQRCGQRTGAGETLVRRVVDAEADGEIAAVEQVRRLLRPLGHEHLPQAPFADPGADALAAGMGAVDCPLFERGCQAGMFHSFHDRITAYVTLYCPRLVLVVSVRNLSITASGEGRCGRPIESQKSTTSLLFNQ